MELTPSRHLPPGGEPTERLFASRHFHDEVTELLLRVAPSSSSFTCIGVENVRAYSYLRRDGLGEEPGSARPRWTSRLADVLPRQRENVRVNEPVVLRPSELGPIFPTSDPGSRVLLVVLQFGEVICGVAGLERASTEPAFARWELKDVGALAGALGLAASYALAVELVAFEEAALRAGGERGSLLMVADQEAHTIIWASSAARAIDWERDVLPVERRLFESGSDRSTDESMGESASLEATAVMARQIAGIGLCAIHCCGPIAAAAEPLSQREREVAKLLVDGYSNLNIAAHLGISENTIRTYIRRLYRKLNVCNRIELIRAYESAG